jgi:hypothetical protein
MAGTRYTATSSRRAKMHEPSIGEKPDSPTSIEQTKGKIVLLAMERTRQPFIKSSRADGQVTLNETIPSPKEINFTSVFDSMMT